MNHIFLLAADKCVVIPTVIVPYHIKSNTSKHVTIFLRVLELIPLVVVKCFSFRPAGQRASDTAFASLWSLLENYSSPC